MVAPIRAQSPSPVDLRVEASRPAEVDAGPASALQVGLPDAAHQVRATAPTNDLQLDVSRLRARIEDQLVAQLPSLEDIVDAGTAVFPELTREYRETVHHWGDAYAALGAAVGRHRETTAQIAQRHFSSLGGIQDWITESTFDAPRTGDHALDRLSLQPDASGTSPDQRLRQAILNSGGNLGPGEVLDMAVRAAGGDYFKGLVTAHNLLKNVAQTERGQYDGPQAGQDRAIRNQLMNLRPPSDGNGDVMGPWYHTYAVGILDAVGTPIIGQLGSRVENLDFTHGTDRYEASINVLAASAFSGGTIFRNLLD